MRKVLIDRSRAIKTSTLVVGLNELRVNGGRTIDRAGISGPVVNQSCVPVYVGGEQPPIVVVSSNAIASERDELEPRYLLFVEELNIPLQCKGRQLLSVCSGPHRRSISSASATRSRTSFAGARCRTRPKWFYVPTAPHAGRELIVAGPSRPAYGVPENEPQYKREIPLVSSDLRLMIARAEDSMSRRR
jgi:hypothetical protein